MALHPCAQNTRERWFSQQASTLGTKWAATTRVDICPFCENKADTHRTGTHTITEDDGILDLIYPIGMTFPVWFCDQITSKPDPTLC
jgi:hypothetical protein